MQVLLLRVKRYLLHLPHRTASSDALNKIATGPQSSTHVFWIVQDTYRIIPDLTNPGRLEYTYNEGHAKFSRKVAGVYEALEKASVAALSRFLNLSARAEDEEEVTVATDLNDLDDLDDLDDYEDEDENLGENETGEQIPLCIKNRLRFVEIPDTKKVKFGYEDVNW